MSKGPGKVACALEAIFANEPDNAFTIEDLCDRVYQGVDQIEKKHRVAVLRAVHVLAKRDVNLDYARSEHLGRTVIFYRGDRVLSYAMARLKADFLNQYRSVGSRHSQIDTEADLRARLQPGGQDQHLVLPGGAWWRHTEMFVAKRDGDAERFAELEKEQEESTARMIETLATSLQKISADIHEPAEAAT